MWCVKDTDFQVAAMLYEHTPERVLGNYNVKILWDFCVQADHKLEHNKPDILITEQQTGEFNITDVACRHKRKEVEQKQEEVEQYHQLKRKTGRLWQCKKMIVIPITIGTLGTIDKDFRTWISQQCYFYMYTISFILFILFTYLSIYLFTFQYIGIWRSCNSVYLLFSLYFTWSEV